MRAKEALRAIYAKHIQDNTTTGNSMETTTSYASESMTGVQRNDNRSKEEVQKELSTFRSSCKRFPTTATAPHRLLQYFNRDSLYDNDVYTIILHQFILSEWLSAYQVSQPSNINTIVFPMSGLLEIAFAAALKSRDLSTSERRYCHQRFVLRQFMILQEIIVTDCRSNSSTSPESAYPTVLVCTVDRTGVVKIFSKSPCGPVLHCSCVITSEDSEVDNLLLSNNSYQENKSCADLDGARETEHYSENGELDISAISEFERNYYILPPRLLDNLLATSGKIVDAHFQRNTKGTDASPWPVVWNLAEIVLEEKALDSFWRGNRCHYAVSRGTETTKSMDVRATDGSTLMSFLFTTDSQMVLSLGQGASTERFLQSEDVRKTVIKVVASVMQTDQSLDAHALLLNEGLDSLGATEVSTRLSQAFGIRVDSTIVFNFPTVADIADELYKVLKNGNSIHASLPQAHVQNYSVNASMQDNSVGIIGLALRFPGGCHSISDMWNEFLLKKKSSASSVPSNRWDPNVIVASKKTANTDLMKQRLTYSHFLVDPYCESTFKPRDFNMMASEGALLHPTQKLLLELCKEALIDAGCYETLASAFVNGKPSPYVTGVFVGIGGFIGTNFNYEPHQDKKKSIEKLSAYSATSNNIAAAAGRIAYVFGFEGPCMAIDTACSSSLVALHNARRSLQLGECDYAIVAGVNILEVDGSVCCAVAGMTSIDGRCHTFDQSANGYSRGEGGGVLILQRMVDCEKSNSVYAVVKGSAVMQDGKRGSLTAPNGSSQEKLIRRALHDSALSSSDVQLVEAHGTGTSLGDPIEAKALASVYCENRDVDNPLLVTSIKANFGHLEAAAGVTGLISAIAAIQTRTAPPNGELKQLNTKISDAIGDASIQFPTAATALAKSPAYAAVSSFGYTGTIAHVIIGEPLSNARRFLSSTGVSYSTAVADVPVEEEKEACINSDSRAMNTTEPIWRLDHALDNPIDVCSCESDYSEDDANTVDNCEAMLDNEYIVEHELQEFQEVKQAVDVEDCEGIDEIECFREICDIDEMQEMYYEMDEVESVYEMSEMDEMDMMDETDGELFVIDYESEKGVEAQKKDIPARLVWQFCGQGSLKVYCAENLYRENSSFQEAIKRCDLIVAPLLGCTISDLLYPIIPNSAPKNLEAAQEKLSDSRYAQPALVAFEYSLACWWRQQGLVPWAVVGHSLGEYVAAVVAGVMTIEDSLKLVCERGKLIQASNATLGTMVALRGSLSVVQTAIVKANASKAVGIAAVNGPNSIVLSGATDAVARVRKELSNPAVITLQVRYAFHSPLLNCVAEEFKSILSCSAFINDKKPLAHSESFYGNDKVLFYSTVTNGLVNDLSDICSSNYWIKHMLQTVHYSECVSQLWADGGRQFIEIGPDATLSKCLKAVLRAKGDNLEDVAYEILPSL